MVSQAQVTCWTKLRRSLAVVIASTAIVLLGPDREAKANGSSTYFHVTCVPELGYFEFAVTSIGGPTADAASVEVKWQVAERFGFFDSRLLYDVGRSERDGARDVVKDKRSQSVFCDLGSSRLEVVFEPHILRVDVTASLTVRIDGQLVLDALHFDSSDRDSSRIDGFSYTAGDSYFALEGLGVADPSVDRVKPIIPLSRRFKFSADGFVPFGDRDFEAVHALMVEATRGDAPGYNTSDEAEFYRVICIPELGKISIRSLTIHGAAATKNYKSGPRFVADRYAIFDGRLLTADRREKILCTLGSDVVEATLAIGGPEIATGATLTLRMNSQLWLDALPFGASESPDAIVRADFTAGLPFFALGGWRNEKATCAQPTRLYAGKAFYFGRRAFEPLRDFDETMAQMIENAPGPGC